MIMAISRKDLILMQTTMMELLILMNKLILNSQDESGEIRDPKTPEELKDEVDASG